jgi:hypothetical protein
MTEEIKKPIADITINYMDGTQSKLQYYAVVGFSENTWYSVTLTPPDNKSKIKMNNFLVESSNKLVQSIGM